MVYTNVINTTLSYKRTLYIEVAYINYLISSLNIFIYKTLVSSFNTLIVYLSIDRKPCYNSRLSLNKSIDPTSISL